MGITRGRKSIADADIPAEIARDSETATAITAHNADSYPHSNWFNYLYGLFVLRDKTVENLYTTPTELNGAIASHVAAVDPHPIYLTQAEGDGLYRKSATALTDADIPAAIARDTETAAAIASHIGAADPHPVYLTQAEGDGLYRKSATALTDADIPAAIARDTETAAAIASHIGAADPHPSLWTRITNAFLSLAGGQAIIKNNPAMFEFSYFNPNNHLGLRTTDGSNPILAFHRSPSSATSLYHSGYGNNSLRIRNADGFDSALLHDGNIGVRHTVVYGKIPPTASSNSLPIAIPAGISWNKIVALSAIALPTGDGGRMYIFPDWGSAVFPGFRYSIYAQDGFLYLSSGTLAESGSILNTDAKIVIGYLP